MYIGITLANLSILKTGKVGDPILNTGCDLCGTFRRARRQIVARAWGNGRSRGRTADRRTLNG
jgi:hypothetical protein